MDNDYKRALHALELQITVGCSSTQDFKLIQQKYIPNCPVTPMDIKVANTIFGPDIGSLKGKMTH